MSDERDPERDQVAPVHNDNPSCHDLVIEDMEERKVFGLRKYSTELQPFNGRSFTQDAYEEVLDLAVYLRGKLYEEDNKVEMSGCPIKGVAHIDPYDYRQMNNLAQYVASLCGIPPGADIRKIQAGVEEYMKGQVNAQARV